MVDSADAAIFATVLGGSAGDGRDCRKQAEDGAEVHDGRFGEAVEESLLWLSAIVPMDMLREN